MTLKEELERAAPVLDRVNDAIRENPLAAGVIGAGVAWMLFGAKGFGVMGGVALGAGGKVVSATKSAGAAAIDAGSTALRAGSVVSSTVKSAATEMAGTVASIVPDFSVTGGDGAEKAVSDAVTAVNERLQGIASSGREYDAAIQSRLAESLESQPLLLGAIGLAIGAGLASTFATTEVESEWLGERGAAARETLQGAVDEAKDRARQVASAVQEEAVGRGLTLDAAKDAAKSVAGKVGNVADAARESVTRPFRSTP